VLSLRFESAPATPFVVAYTAAELRAALEQRTTTSDHVIWLGATEAKRPLAFRVSSILSFYDDSEQTQFDQLDANSGKARATLRLRCGYEFRLFTEVEEIAEKLRAADSSETWKDIFIVVRACEPVGQVEINSRQVERFWEWGTPV
jgi:hypothetical protein